MSPVQVVQILLRAWSSAEVSDDSKVARKGLLERLAPELSFDVIMCMLSDPSLDQAFRSCPALLLDRAAGPGKLGRSRTVRAVRLLLDRAETEALDIGPAVLKSLGSSYLHDHDQVLVQLCHRLGPECATRALAALKHQFDQDYNGRGASHFGAARDAYIRFATVFGLDAGVSEHVQHKEVTLNAPTIPKSSSVHDGPCLDIDLGCVLLVDHPSKLEQAREALFARSGESSQIIGIDAEWLPSRYGRDPESPVALLQMSTGRTAVLFDMLNEDLCGHFDMALLMHDLLVDASVIKLGYGLREDVDRLRLLPTDSLCFDVVSSLAGLEL